MARRTNASALRVTVAALRQQERLEQADAALVHLAEALAQRLDRALAGDEKAYALANLSKTYFGVLLSLRDASPPIPDAFEALLAQLSGPEERSGGTAVW
jgi:hypothetical protein